MQNPIDYQAFTDAEPIENESRKPFEITDDSLAEWAMRKIAEARSDTVKWADHFAAQMDRILKANEETEAFFSAALARYFETVPRKKTATQEKYTLPCGELIRKKQAPKFTQDDEQLVPFLQENDLSEFVKLKSSSDWYSLKKCCTVMEDGSVVEQSTGMVLPGVVAETRPDKFEVKINGN